MRRCVRAWKLGKCELSHQHAVELGQKSPAVFTGAVVIHGSHGCVSVSSSKVMFHIRCGTSGDFLGPLPKLQ